MWRLVNEAADLRRLDLPAQHFQPQPSADPVKTGAVTGFIRKVPATAAARFQPNRPARKKASGEPIRKLGKTPMKEPKAKPRPVLAGVEFSRTTRRACRRSQCANLLPRVVWFPSTCEPPPVRKAWVPRLGLPIGRSEPRRRFPPQQNSTARAYVGKIGRSPYDHTIPLARAVGGLETGETPRHRECALETRRGWSRQG